MNDFKRIFIPILLVLALFIIMTVVLKYNTGKQCEKNVYFFKHNDKYIKADSQKFLIMITGQVGNAYFMIGNIEYSTLDYYKQPIVGVYDEQGECITH